jgi:uncharacterized membrane protein YjjP (DUF1212 family)
MNDSILIISGLALLVVLYIVSEGAAIYIDQRANPDREAKRPRYKPIWQVVGVIGWNGPAIAAFLLRGEWAALVVAAISLTAYAVFRYRLARSSSMQRRFFSLPLPRDDSSSHSRNT